MDTVSDNCGYYVLHYIQPDSAKIFILAGIKLVRLKL